MVVLLSPETVPVGPVGPVSPGAPVSPGDPGAPAGPAGPAANGVSFSVPLTHRPFGGKRIAPVLLLTQMLSVVDTGGVLPAWAVVFMVALLPMMIPPAMHKVLQIVSRS